MAKKKAGTRGAPQKTCPKCSVTCHARSSKCPGCGYEFPAAASKPGGSPSRARGDSEKAAMQFVLFNNGGNIDKALKAVEAYSEDDLAAFIMAQGGPAKAKAVLEELKKKAS